MTTDLEERTDIDEALQMELPRYAHIIDRGDDDRPAAALVLEAMVNGTTLTALCGHKWTPSRDPSKFPVCPKCKEMFEFARDFRGV